MATPYESDAEQEPAAITTKRNRLTIAHFLLWMAGTALVLVTFPTDWLPLRNLPANRAAFVEQLELHDTTQKMLTALVAPLYGTAVASLPMAGQRWLERRGGFPTQPGHWLLILLGLLYLLVALAARFQAALVHPPASVVAFLLVTALVGVSTAAVVQVRELTVWLLTFRVFLAGSALLVVARLVGVWHRESSSLYTASAVLYIAAGVVGLIAVVRDVYRQARYDLFHWAGVSVLASSLATPLLAYGVGTWLF